GAGARQRVTDRSTLRGCTPRLRFASTIPPGCGSSSRAIRSALWLPWRGASFAPDPCRRSGAPGPGGRGVCPGPVGGTSRSCGASLVDSFQGAEHYIAPSLDPDSGKALPTWNYSVVHVHGKIRFQDSSDEALGNVTALAEAYEKARSTPWAVTDSVAPLLKRI